MKSYIEYEIEHVDTDASGVVHFSRYASLMETAFLRVMRYYNIAHDFLRDKTIDLRVVHVEISYVDSLYFSDEIIIKVKVDALGQCQCVVSAQIFRENQLVAHGKIRFAFVDWQKGTVIRCPDSIYKKLENIYNDCKK